MGAWGTDTFENDTACDWAIVLKDRGLELVTSSLQAVLDTGAEYLDADVGVEGLAAADVVAHWHGSLGQQDAPMEEIGQWLRAQSDPVSTELIADALAVVDRVLAKDSELAELWDETDDANEWRQRVETVRARLTAQP